LRKTDDVRKYVVRREIKKGDKTFYKSPKIQRLITEKRLRRKRLYKREKVNNYKKSLEDKAKYDKLLSKHIKERKALHDAKKHADEHQPKEVKPAQTKAAQGQTKAADAKKAAAPIKQAQQTKPAQQTTATQKQTQAKPAQQRPADKKVEQAAKATGKKK
jgi:hypothetical protein